VNQIAGYHGGDAELHVVQHGVDIVGLLAQLGGALGNALFQGRVLHGDDRHHLHVVADEENQHRHEAQIHHAERQAHVEANLASRCDWFRV
jgi:hypothetical protein